MFDKGFSEMMRVDVGPHLKTRDGAPYLPWGACKKLLHDNGAEVVMFWPVPGEDGSTLRKSDTEFADKNGVKNRCYEVMVHIVVDGLEWDTVYPVINGNNPVKDNSMSQLRVHNAVRRAFVKGVAERTGLGFALWLDDDDLAEEEDLSRHSLLKCRERMEQLITWTMNQKGLPFEVISDRLGKDPDEVRGMMKWYNALARMEKAIAEMQP